MRRLVGGAAFGLALILLALSAIGAQARKSDISPRSAVGRSALDCHGAGRHCVHSPRRVALRRKHSAPLALHVSVGFGGRYRTSAWVPVRATLQNTGFSTLTGTLSVPDQGIDSDWAQPAFASLYETRVVLAPGASKRVTLYVPGQDLRAHLTVAFRMAGQAAVVASAAPEPFDDSTATIGVLSSAPDYTGWLSRVRLHESGLTTIRLSPANLDPVAEVLANFDAIVVTNVDTSGLDADQRGALVSYVRDGGSVLVVGGPDWQETLRSLPPDLVPGSPAGSQLVFNLSGLHALGYGIPRPAATIISRLNHVRGAVLASESQIPLAIRATLGQGRLLYLAFDPSTAPMAGWSGAGPLLSDILMQAATHLVPRIATSTLSWQSGSLPGLYGPAIVREELANLPDAATPTLILLIVLGVASLVVIGPLNFFVISHLGRRELAWLTMPALSAVCLGSSLTVAAHARNKLALINTVGVIQLNGRGGAVPASLYVGLFAPMRGDYHLAWNGTALLRSLPDYVLQPSASSYPSLPDGMAFQEGAQTSISLASMNMWSMRSFALTTSVYVPGSLQAQLHLTPDGAIAGTVRNATRLTIVRPLLVAGSAILQLANLPPGAVRAVRLFPRADPYQSQNGSLWDRIYHPPADLGSWDGDPWEEPPPGAERTLTDRLRNVADRLPDARSVTSLGEVLFLGWTLDTLGTFTIDRVQPSRRNLTLIVSPLSVGLPKGTFQLRPGTLGAVLVDDRPQAPADGCCPPPSGQQIFDIGPGGSATYQFTVPDAGHVRFRRLAISINTGGAVGPGIAQVYDWVARRWVPIDMERGPGVLPRPNRFVASSGALLVRLTASLSSGDLTISNPYEDLQLSGSGTRW